MLDWFGLEPDRYDYFKGIATHLRCNNFRVYTPRVEFAGSVQQRARDLAHEVRRILAKTDAVKVHIIAHSMGGRFRNQLLVESA